ncbi:hypothetical protein ACSTIN_12875 [Vibrio parahaemolyticus]
MKLALTLTALLIASTAFASELYVRFLNQSEQDIYLCEKHGALLLCDAYTPRTIITDSFNTTTYN